jgi:lysine 6-dehydrogenase
VRAVVLGGAGDVGSRAVEDLTVAPGVTHVTIADRDVAGAERVARRAGSQRGAAPVTVERVDARDHARLVAVMRGHDVAASALGPFHLFEVPLVAAALEAGVDYASVCDEWDAAEAVLERFDDRARSLGRTVVPGLGVSPGLTNLAARLLRDELDTLDRVRISVFQPLTAGGGRAVLEHMLFIMEGHVAVWRQGARRAVRALSEERSVDFPRFGRLRTWNMGHAEPVTLPRFLPGLSECDFFMGFGPASRLLVQPARFGAFANAKGRQLIASALDRLERMGGSNGNGRTPDPGAVRIDCWGTLHGAPARRMACGLGEMRNATGLSLSVGALMLAQGDGVTKTGGVLPPEASLEPRRFFEHLKTRGLEGHRDLAQSRALV